VFFASSIAMNGAIVHLSALLTDRGVSAGRAALAISTMGAASFAGRVTTGWFLDRFFGPRVSFVLLSIAATGTYLLASADSFATGALAAALIGFGMGGELDVTPYLLSRYFGLLAGAVGPMMLGRAFDATGSYDALLPKIALFMFTISLFMLTLPDYAGARRTVPAPPAEQIRNTKSTRCT
jgi:cyanate permease